MTSRTTFSKWLYRTVLGLMMLGTLRLIRFAWDELSPMLSDTDAVTYWIALMALMTNPLALVMACIAMITRSGAVVWLLGVQALSMILPLSPSVMGSGNPAIIALVAGLTALTLALSVLIFRYLIRRGELRRP